MSHDRPRVSRRAFLISSAIAALGGCIGARADGAVAEGADFPAYDTPLAAFTHLRPGLDARYSPTGEEIVFDLKGPAGRQLWRARMDRSGTTCLTGDNPSLPSRPAGNGRWHPSGQWIVFQALKPAPHPDFFGDPALGGHNDIWVLPTEGGTAHKLYDLPCAGFRHFALLQPGWSPDGTRLVWAESYTPATLQEPWGRWRLMIADFDVNGSSPRLENLAVLPDLATPGYREFDEFLTGDTLLVSGNHTGRPVTALDVSLYGLATGAHTALTDGLAFDQQAHASAHGIAFVSTGAHRPPRGPFDFTARTELWLMDRDGSDLRQLSAFNDPAYLARIGARRATVAMLDWHPDGSERLVVSVLFTHRFGIRREQLFLARLT